MRDLFFVMLPLAARASAEDFYFPRDVVRAWHGALQPEEALERLTRLTIHAAKQEPVRAAKAMGRNEPSSGGAPKPRRWGKPLPAAAV